MTPRLQKGLLEGGITFSGHNDLSAGPDDRVSRGQNQIDALLMDQPRHQAKQRSTAHSKAALDFVPALTLGIMCNALVCLAVWIMRVRRPDLQRGFLVPALPVVAVLGLVVCGAMIYGLGKDTWLRLVVWLLIGMFIYFGYSRSHSRLNKA